MGKIVLGKEFQGDAKLTCVQDCSLITATFERAANHDMSEASVFAPLYKTLDITKNFSGAAQQALQSYLITPPSTSINDLQTMAGEIVSPGATEVTMSPLVSEMISKAQAGVSDAMSQSVMDRISNCIPCFDRLISVSELHAHLNLTGALKADVLKRINIVSNVMSLLKDFNSYNDLCKMFALLKDQCVPDLQRIIAMLTVIMSFRAPKLDDLFIGINGLIAPIFTPIFLSMSVMFDQFSLIVLSPIDCIIDNLNYQMQKIYTGLDPNFVADVKDTEAKVMKKVDQVTEGVEDVVNDVQELIKAGVGELSDQIKEAQQEIVDKLDYYLGQFIKLIGDETTTSSMTIELYFGKLKIIRMIAFINAIVNAIIKGQLGCGGEDKLPTDSELDNFFANFLNPNLPYSMKIDPDGNLTIDEQIPGYDNVFESPTADPNVIGRKIDWDAEELSSLPDDITAKLKELKSAVTSKINVTLPCTLKTNLGNSAKIDSWIQELNKEV